MRVLCNYKILNKLCLYIYVKVYVKTGLNRTEKGILKQRELSKRQNKTF